MCRRSISSRPAWRMCAWEGMEVFPAPRPVRCLSCDAALPERALRYCSTRCRRREEKRRARWRQRAQDTDTPGPPSNQGKVGPLTEPRSAPGGEWLAGHVGGQPSGGEQPPAVHVTGHVTGHVDRRLRPPGSPPVTVAGHGDRHATTTGAVDDRSVVAAALGVASALAVRARRTAFLETELMTAQGATATSSRDLAALRERLAELERDAGTLARIVEAAFEAVGWDGYEAPVRDLVDRHKSRGR